MTEGTVLFYNSERGFGYIKRSDGLKDIVFRAGVLHESGLVKLAEGQKVTFDAHKDPTSGKLDARAIRIL